MQLASVRTSSGLRAARVEGDELVLLPHAGVTALLASGSDWIERAGADGERIPAAGASYAPLTEPRKTWCVGLNYLLHVKEGGRDVPTHPTLFAKFTEALTGGFDDIAIRATTQKVDWEAELVVVIGRDVRDATEQQAIDAIAGFACGNDVSMRDWQTRTSQWLQGKTWEASSPVGPTLVTLDEVGSPRPDLAISCLVDGEVMQDARTSDLLFDPVHCVQYASTIMTLRPGDLIFTGTPEGVGNARTPPIFLKPGSVMTTRIEKLGEMRNAFVAA